MFKWIENPREEKQFNPEVVDALVSFIKRNYKTDENCVDQSTLLM
jgi:hypothetical protein